MICTVVAVVSDMMDRCVVALRISNDYGMIRIQTKTQVALTWRRGSSVVV